VVERRSLSDYDDRALPPKVLTAENEGMPYMPYVPRACQGDMVSDIRRALDEGRHILMESGTGTGKTIVSLAGALEHAKARGKKIVYLTRTISQCDQVMKELKAISCIRDVSGMTVTGRSKSCPLHAATGQDPLPPGVLSLMCEDRKQRSNRGQAGGCRYYDRTKGALDSAEAYCRASFPTSDELDRHCESLGACPYEVKKMLMRRMDVVVAPYIQVLSEDIRANFLSNLGGEDAPMTLIVDEAHNLADAAREQESFSLTMRSIESALDECAAVKSRSIAGGIAIDDFLRHLRASVKRLASEHIPFSKTEAVLPKDALEDAMLSRLKIGREGLSAAIGDLIGIGEARMEALSEDGARASSEILAVGTALSLWIGTPSDGYVRGVKTGDDGEYLHAACIDPKRIVEFMQGLPGAVHMSGTLAPLEQYQKIMGLPKNSVPRTYPSPFPKENKKVVYVGDMSTKYEDMQNPAVVSRMEDRIVRLCNAVEKNTLVFFTSYRMMRSMRPAMERGIAKSLFWEESGRQKSTSRSLDAFRRGRNGVFFSVMGGSVAEGIDFPGDELCFAVIVGIPYPPPSIEAKAAQDLLDARYGPGTGWKFTSETPAVRKIRQAVGRLIRTETDRGMAVILDSRASRYERQLDATLSLDPVGDAARFFGEG
jgi:DNA excision repair protein ERCC-2